MNLNSQISKFYDRSTPLWVKIWGVHMHHGYYGKDGQETKDRVKAQIDMIEAVLDRGEIKNVTSFLDVGCGVGGSTRYIAQKYNARGLGVTLSKVQADHANQFNDRADLNGAVAIQVRDMMSLSAKDGLFDLVWSMESAEHIEDKQKLFNLLYDRLLPGGKLLIATWCIREPLPPINSEEEELLRQICRSYHLPPLVPISSLVRMAKESGFKVVQSEDWSKAIAPFWKTVIKTALTVRGLTGILLSGISTIRDAWAMRYMQKGFKKDLLKFGILWCEK